MTPLGAYTEEALTTSRSPDTETTDTTSIGVNPPITVSAYGMMIATFRHVRWVGFLVDFPSVMNTGGKYFSSPVTVGWSRILQGECIRISYWFTEIRGNLVAVTMINGAGKHVLNTRITLPATVTVSDMSRGGSAGTRIRRGS